MDLPLSQFIYVRGSTEVGTYSDAKIEGNVCGDETVAATSNLPLKIPFR